MLVDSKGFSLIELVVATALAGMVIAMSAAPIMQMKALEKKVEYLSSIEIAHQIAMQKARNGTFLKEKLGIVAGEMGDRCFGGRGRSSDDCSTLKRSDYLGNTSLDKIHFSKEGSYTSTSAVNVLVNCSSSSCTDVVVTVTTQQTLSSSVAIASNWNARPMSASFTVPAAALASRQEIDFSCVAAGQVVAGIDYKTLKAICLPFTGMKTCDSQSDSGPMTTFGGSNSAANCQPPVSTSCGEGMASFGLISGQVSCTPLPTCTDPLSTNCQTPPPIPVCNPVWQPAWNPALHCPAESIVQNNGCVAPNYQERTVQGTNNSVCPATPCSAMGTVKWPDPTFGPCENTSVVMTAAPGSNASIVNSNRGYYGTFRATCQANSTFNMNITGAGAATWECKPIVCDLNSIGTPIWSAEGLKSSVAGPGLDTTAPWSCSGPKTITQAPPSTSMPALGAGLLKTTQADSTAKATALNTSSAATSGALTLTCSDPGPTGTSHAGVLIVSASCVQAPSLPAADGVCGAANRGNFRDAATATAAGLCGGTIPSPSPAALAGPGPIWSWQCNGTNSTVGPTCSANLKVDGVCGTANGHTYVDAAAATSAGLCNEGNANPLILFGSGPTWTWQCNGINSSVNASCSATKSVTPVDGVCGAANGRNFADADSATAAGLCGGASPLPSPATLSGGGPTWTWQCAGINSSVNPTCSATIASSPKCLSMGGTLTQRCTNGSASCAGAETETACHCPDGRWAWIFGGPDPSSSLYVPGGVAALECRAATPIACSGTFDQTCSLPFGHGSCSNGGAWNNYKQWLVTQLQAMGVANPESTYGGEINGSMADWYNSHISRIHNMGGDNYSSSYNLGGTIVSMNMSWTGNEENGPGSANVTLDGNLSGDLKGGVCSGGVVVDPGPTTTTTLPSLPPLNCSPRELTRNGVALRMTVACVNTADPTGYTFHVPDGARMRVNGQNLSSYTFDSTSGSFWVWPGHSARCEVNFSKVNRCVVRVNATMCWHNQDVNFCN